MSDIRSRRRVSVVLPPPDLPTRPIRAPAGTSRSSPRKIGFAPACAKVTASKRMPESRGARGAGASASTTVGGSSSNSVNWAASVVELSSRR